MKKLTLYFFAYSLLTFLAACGTDSSPDDDSGTFEVPFEMFVPANQLSDGSWNVSNGGFAAAFRARDGVHQYEMRIVNENGTKGDPFIRNSNQLEQDGDLLRLVVVVGTPTFYIGVSESQKDAAIAEFEEALAALQQTYHKLEVTVL